MLVYWKTGNFNTVFFREFHNHVRTASSKFNTQFSVQFCLAIIAMVSPFRQSVAVRFTPTSVTFPVGCSSVFSFHLGAEKITSILFSEAKQNKAAAQVIHAFVTSHLNYCNAVLGELSEKSLLRLRSVQHHGTRLVTLTRKYDTVTPVLKSLHWLPVSLCTWFKIPLLTYIIWHQATPCYLYEIASTSGLHAPGGKGGSWSSI